VSGYSSYYPAALPRRLGLARSIPNPRALDELQRETGLRYVWVHTDELDPKVLELWTHLAARPSARLEMVVRDGADWLFAVHP
jgi:hypothetical protein